MNHDHAFVRVTTALLIVVSMLGTIFPAQAQTPQPQGSPILIPENDPLSPSSMTALPPVPMQTPASFGGNPLASNLVSPPDDRENSTQTGWFVYQHQTAQNISDFIAANNARLVDISIEAISPSYLFSVSYVSNTGSYAKGWWWYYNITASTLSTLLTANNARIISLKAIDIGGGDLRFTAIMISNTGADAIGWWWYYNASISGLTAAWQANNARLTQIHSYVLGGQTYYAAVMVDNTGLNARGWWWYVNATVPQLITNISTNNARLVDLDKDPTTNNYNVIMYSCSSGCPLWWWYVGVPTSQLLNLSNQLGARIIDVNTYAGCGDQCWDILYINNSNDITSRVGQILRSGTDGTVGLYLKQVGGSVLANLMDSTTFEPASTIKAAVHLYVMRELQNGIGTLSTLIPEYQPLAAGTSCPTNTVIGNESVLTANLEMMWHSDNVRTRELVDHYGVANINSMLTSLGMSQTSINHVIGCGGPVPDTTTLDNLATLYEGVANATLVDAAHRTTFFSEMAGKPQFVAQGYDWTHLWDTDIPNLINQEAPAAMSTAAKNAFRNLMDLEYKAGNYKICTNGTCSTYVDHISIFGYAKIPFCDGGGARQFVFGTYIYNSTSDANSSATFNAVKAELLREQIRAGLATCLGQPIVPFYLPFVTK